MKKHKVALWTRYSGFRGCEISKYATLFVHLASFLNVSKSFVHKVLKQLETIHRNVSRTANLSAKGILIIPTLKKLQFIQQMETRCY